jgi:hypothetical protein
MLQSSSKSFPANFAGLPFMTDLCQDAAFTVVVIV